MRHFLILILLVIPIYTSFAGEITKDQARQCRQEGYDLQNKGDVAAALMAYQKAVQIDPHYAEAFNDLGVIYEQTNDLDSALSSYTKAIELDPDYLPAYTNMAFLQEKLGDVKKASVYWQKRYEKGQEGEYWTEVSKQHLLELGMYPELKKMTLEKAAIKLSQELNNLREQTRVKKNAEALNYYEIGLQLFKQGDFPGALKNLESARSVSPSDQELIKKIDELYDQANKIINKEKAFSLVREAAACVKSDDYLGAAEKVKAAQTVLTQLSAQQNSK